MALLLDLKVATFPSSFSTNIFFSIDTYLWSSQKQCTSTLFGWFLGHLLLDWRVKDSLKSCSSSVSGCFPARVSSARAQCSYRNHAYTTASPVANGSLITHNLSYHLRQLSNKVDRMKLSATEYSSRLQNDSSEFLLSPVTELIIYFRKPDRSQNLFLANLFALICD